LKLRRLKIETMVYLIPYRGEAAIRRDELFFRLCGIRNIIGIPRGDLKTRRYDPVTDRYEAEASRLARSISQIGEAHSNDPASWDLHLSDEEQARAINALRPLNGAPFLALGIGSKEDVKDWGVENWKALMPKLRRNFSEHALVFIGAKEDRPAADEVAAEWPGKSYNMSGDLSPRESAAVIQRARLLLSLDSGPMHLAASVGTPCVAIFSARTRPGVWFPYGDAHEVIYHKTDCFNCGLDVCEVEKKKCILSISPDEVSAAAVRIRERTRACGRRPSDSVSMRRISTERQFEPFRVV
jgi:ADP-heptose:LPS heptosyltransferase